MVERLKLFIQSYDKVVIFFPLFQIVFDLGRPYSHDIMRKTWFLRFSVSLLINYLITLSVKREIIVLVKSLEKVLNFGSKICTNPATPKSWLK